MLYALYEAQRDLTAPVRAMAQTFLDCFEHLDPYLPQNDVVRFARAWNEMVARSTFIHTRPSFRIDQVVVDGRPIPVTEETVSVTPFASLVHFRKDADVPLEPQPRLLIVAALAGHFATLLRSTVRALLPDHDVYITDWHNARDVATAHGPFGLDDYVDHLVDFLHHLGPGTNVLAVCQPCPATLMATAALAQAGDEAVPATLTLMAGPVDGRISPTVVNEFAAANDLDWFERQLITTVPGRHRGRGRRVYPGFLQLSAFMSMNFGRHVDQHLALFHEVVVGNEGAADAIRDFYDEYFAVLDLPAEFYLDTVDQVFQRHLLARGEAEYHGRRIDLRAITTTALLTVEAGRDDICGIGQTIVAHELCANVLDHRRATHVEPDVGHYGVFSGRAWDRSISPIVRDFIAAHA